MVNVVVLSASGESRTLKTTAVTTAAVTGAAVAKVFRRKQTAERIGSWTWKGRTLALWGWREGKAGNENKHELPPPHDGMLLFGDALVVSEGGELTVEEWSVFYDAAFGGFEDLVDSEDEDDDEEDDDDEEEDDEEDDAADEEDDDVPDAEEEEESADDDSESEDEDGEASDEEEEEEEADDDDDCYDDGDDGGGGKRRAPRRRTAATPDCRRIDMGLRSRVKLPTPVGKRAPRWQTAAELEEEAY
jgi:hypothetical protein